MAVEPTRDGDSGSDAESGDTGPLPPAALRDCLRTAAVLAGSSSSTHVPPAGISFVDLLQARLEHIGDAGAPVPAGSGPLESHEPTNSSLQHNDAADPSTSALSADRSGAAAVRARFVRACLACLAKTAHVQRSLPGSQVDGVKDQSALESLVPIVVCWGMVPALDLFSSKKVLMAFKMPTNSSPNPQKLPDGASDNSGVPEAPLDRYIFADAIDQLMQLVQLDRGGFVVDILRRRYLSHLILSALAVQADAVAADLLIASSGKTLSQEICWAFTTSICETLGTRLGMDALMSLLADPPRGFPVPRWLSMMAGTQLSTLILRNDGVLSLLLLLLTSDDSPPTATQLEQIARLLLSPPSKIPKPKYFSNISAQLRSIIADAAASARPVSLAASFTMVHFVNMRPELGAKYFIDPILASLQAFYLDPESNLPPDSVLVADTRISTAVESIERLIAGSEPSPTLMRIISKVVPQLYFLWEKAEASKLVMRSALRQILEAFFKLADVSDAVAALYDVALKSATRPIAEIVRSEAGGLSFVVPAKPLLERIRAGENQVVDLEAFCAFVAGLEQPSIVGELFLAVLEGSLRARRSHTLDANAACDSDDDDGVTQSAVSGTSKSAASDPSLLAVESPTVSAAEALCEAAEMQHAAAILAMMNEFGDALLKDTRQVLQFVKSMLIDSEHEGIALALTLLKEIFSAASLDLDDDAQRVIADIRIILQTLTQHPDEDIRAASREIRAAMAARLAPANVGPSSSQDTLSSTAQDAAAMAAEKKARDQFREALKNLGDELLPVRAFGMSVLRQLVLDRSAVARENLESIISIFLDLVEDEDSFIYLNAVKGLSALTDVYAPQTLSRIAKRYMDKESLTLDYRVRIGEALMQTIHRSGQVFPKHGK